MLGTARLKAQRLQQLCQKLAVYMLVIDQQYFGLFVYNTQNTSFFHYNLFITSLLYKDLQRKQAARVALTVRYNSPAHELGIFLADG